MSCTSPPPEAAHLLSAICATIYRRMRLSTLIHELSHELSAELSAALLDALSAALRAIRSGRGWQLNIVVDKPDGSPGKMRAAELSCGGKGNTAWLSVHGGTISGAESIGGTVRRDPAGVLVLDPHDDD